MDTLLCFVLAQGPSLSAPSPPSDHGPPPQVLLILTKDLGSASFLPTLRRCLIPSICISRSHFKRIPISLCFRVPPALLFSSTGQLRRLPLNLIFCCCWLCPVLLVLVGLFIIIIIILAAPWSLRDFSSLTRDWTQTLGNESAES